MPKHEPEPPIKGADALLDLIALLKDPDAYARKLADLQARQAAINASIELAGKADAIPGLYAAAAEQNQRATVRLTEARTEAEAIKAAAVRARDEARADADLARAEAVDARRQMAEERQRFGEWKVAQEAEIGRLSAEASMDRRAAGISKEEAAALQAKWQEAVDRLAEAGVRL